MDEMVQFWTKCMAMRTCSKGRHVMLGNVVKINVFVRLSEVKVSEQASDISLECKWKGKMESHSVGTLRPSDT